MAIDAEDEADVGPSWGDHRRGKGTQDQGGLIAEDVTPAALHQLLRTGADEFRALPAARRRAGRSGGAYATPDPVAAPAEAKVKLKGGGDGVLIAVQGICGGSGATTLAVNLAYELATPEKDEAPRVCLLDFGLQFGSVATYLDRPRRDAVMEVLTNN